MGNESIQYCEVISFNRFSFYQ